MNLFSPLTDGGDGGDDLSQLELVQDGRLSGGVESDHQDAHLLLAEEALEQRGEHVAHGQAGKRRRKEKEEKVMINKTTFHEFLHQNIIPHQNWQALTKLFNFYFPLSISI